LEEEFKQQQQEQQQQQQQQQRQQDVTYDNHRPAARSEIRRQGPPGHPAGASTALLLSHYLRTHAEESNLKTPPAAS
jgi:hypothetical protein